MCLAAGAIRPTVTRPADADLQHWTRGWLGGALGHQAAKIIVGGGRVVQETVGVELLSSMDDPARLFELE